MKKVNNTEPKKPFQPLTVRELKRLSDKERDKYFTQLIKQFRNQK